MKKMILIMALAAISQGARAYEYPDNPDRFPSMGFNYAGNNMDGSQNVSTSDKLYGMDLRFPLSNMATLTVFGNGLNSEMKTSGSVPISKLNGFGYGASLRFYFNEKKESASNSTVHMGTGNADSNTESKIQSLKTGDLIEITFFNKYWESVYFRQSLENSIEVLRVKDNKIVVYKLENIKSIRIKN